MIGSASVSRLAGLPVHCEHRASAVSAFKHARINIVVDLYATVVITGATFTVCTGNGEGAVIDNRLMIVFNNNMFAVITPDVFAVDFRPCIFTLTQSADIKIVFKNI